jgi:hypothetical protein
MRLVKTLFLILVAVSAIASVMVASASAVPPTVLLLSGEKLPVLILSGKDPNAIKYEVQSEAATLEGEGLLLDVMITNLNDTPDGSYLLLLLKYKEKAGKKESCNTPGDKTGEILIPTNLIHLVYDKLGTGTALGVGLLFLISEFGLSCGAGLKVKMKGEVLGLIMPINTEAKVELGSLKARLKCSSTFGVPEESKYWNAAGEEKKAVLLTTAGAGFESGCLSILSEIPLEPMTMIEIMG